MSLFGLGRNQKTFRPKKSAPSGSKGAQLRKHINATLGSGNLGKLYVVSSPKYVEYLMDWIEGQLDDESIFPQKLGTPFPPNFKEVAKTIFKCLFRVYAHIYHSHFQKIVSLKEEDHLNTCFKHFILFTNEFGLIDKKSWIHSRS
ncbi:unnamed protein product [Miscanthus lutarioriparius]|uniref:Uncharacterized protein n=1 Tax=Miscanthus lutarioriparius TaxID=422564 RepID=A0A811PVM2_9POAL|nr:unnamed protein product [Miscanthus lutarioriparius]